MRIRGLIVAAVAAACFASAADAGTHAKAPCKAGQAGGTCTRAWMPAFPKGCSQFTSLVQSSLGLSGLSVTRKMAGHGAGNTDLECVFSSSDGPIYVDFVDRGVTASTGSSVVTGVMAGMTGCAASADDDPAAETPLGKPTSLGVGQQSYLFAPCASGFVVWDHNSVGAFPPVSWVRVGSTRWNVAPGFAMPGSKVAALTRALVAKYH